MRVDNQTHIRPEKGWKAAQPFHDDFNEVLGEVRMVCPFRICRH